MKCWRSKAPRATHSLVGEQVCQSVRLTAQSQTALNGGRVVVTGGKLSSGCKRTISSEKLTLTLGLEGMNSNPLGRINSLGRIFQAKEHSMCECANLEDIPHPGTSQKDSKAGTDLVERGTLGNDPEYEFRHVKACSTRREHTYLQGTNGYFKKRESNCYLKNLICYIKRVSWKYMFWNKCFRCVNLMPITCGPDNSSVRV